ncbi:MAG: FtsX-like permease family protein [Oleiphilaceae bacterium]|nr:FtsX-like permease family protein [Oleiphilaceae bacterium]
MALFGNALTLLWRQRQQFSLRLLLLALILAVMSVTAIVVVSGQLNTAMQLSATRFIGADRQLTSPRAVPQQWLQKAEALGLESARALEFSSMLSGADRFQLVSVKAVDDGYPLKGELLVSTPGAARSVAQQGPKPGDIWLQKRLFNLLALEHGHSVAVGKLPLQATRTLEQEPDVGFQLAGLSPRVLMHLDDVEATGVVQPGSRLTWRYYFNGSAKALAAYETWLEPQLDKTHRWMSVKEGRPAIARALEKTETYLLLGASLAVLLACLAIAMSARQFALEQADAIAVMKTLGAQKRALFGRFAIQLCLLAVFGLTLGGVLGLALAQWAAGLLEAWVPEINEVATLPSPSVLLLPAMTSLASLLCFAWPPLVQVSKVPPMRVLREDGLMRLGFSKISALIAVGGIVGLLAIYLRDPLLITLLLSGLALSSVLLLGLFMGFATLVRGTLLPALPVASTLRHAALGLLRQRGHTLVQGVLLALVLLLVALLTLARESLLNDWQTQLPEDAPNHFLINIAPYELDGVRDTLAQAGLSTAGLYPMVRGRLSHINDVSVKVAVTKDVAALNRELNLTWSDALPEDNTLEEGAWWSAVKPGIKGVSVESRLAENLDLKLGDKLRFAIGGGHVDAEVTSIRTVQWESMRPNFYMMFESGALDSFPATYITSFHLPDNEKQLLNTLARNFPSVSILELDQVVGKVRQIVEQVSVMVQLILGLILVAALLVLSALIAATYERRRHAVALMRTMGASRRFVQRSQFLEFFLLGLLAGLAAVAAAELSMWQLQARLFDAPFTVHPQVWWQLPLATSMISGLLASVQMRKVVATSPMESLR